MQEHTESNPEELIKNTLYAYDVEDRNYNSTELITTLRQSTYLPPKSHSFRQLSDWNNRYRLDNSLPHSPNIKQLNIFNIEKESEKFSYLVSHKKRTKQAEALPASPKKQKFQLAPISVKFQNKINGIKQKKDSSDMAKYRLQEANISIYQSNYHPLNALYKLRTRERHQKHKESLTEELPLIVPQSITEPKFPKTERMSSILRLMKRSQQIRSLRKRSSRQKQDMFKLPFDD